MAVTTVDCKKAITDWVKSHPGHVSRQFDPPESEADAQLERNWKRMWKRRCDKRDIWANSELNLKAGMWERGFDCRPYDDQLRAYTYDDGERIVCVVVQGE
jgi:hypothetical protein